MSLLFVVEKSRHAGTDAWDAAHALTVESSGTARWFDPSAQHVTWGLRLTNATDNPISDLTALFTYAATCGSSASGLSLTSTSARGGAIRSWGHSRSLARTYPGTIAAWETLLVTGVFTSSSNAGGSVSVSFGLRSSGVELAALSADF